MKGLLTLIASLAISTGCATTIPTISKGMDSPLASQVVQTGSLKEYLNGCGPATASTMYNLSNPGSPTITLREARRTSTKLRWTIRDINHFLVKRKVNTVMFKRSSNFENVKELVANNYPVVLRIRYTVTTHFLTLVSYDPETKKWLALDSLEKNTLVPYNDSHLQSIAINGEPSITLY